MKKIKLVVAGHPVQVEVERDGKTPNSSCWLAAAGGYGKGSLTTVVFHVEKITPCFIYATSFNCYGRVVRRERLDRSVVAAGSYWCWVQRASSGNVWALDRSGGPVLLSEEGSLNPSLSVVVFKKVGSITSGFHDNYYRRVGDLPSCCWPADYYAVTLEKVTPGYQNYFVKIDAFELFLIQEGYYENYCFDSRFLISEEDFQNEIKKN